MLEAGLGGDHRSWTEVAPELARTTRTCSYDRAGLGLSRRDGARRTGRDQVDDLRKLLRQARVAPPYVLVGHSYGGILVHEYASEHPGEVVGVVLVDSSHPFQTPRFLEALGPPRRGEPRLRTELRSFLSGVPRNVEGLDMNATFREARAEGGLGGMPLVVITARCETSASLPPALKSLLDRTWLSLQDDLARLSTNSVHVIALRSPHEIQGPLGQPALVVRAIREVVQAAREHVRLPRCESVFPRLGGRCVSS